MMGLEEKRYYSNGISTNCRYDGRNLNSISKLLVEKQSVQGSQVSSSVSYVDSHITCTINLNINTEWRVYIKTLIKGEDNTDHILCWDRAERLNHLLKSLMFSNSKLKEQSSIQDSGYYWNFEINLSTWQVGGSLIDASSYAIVSALSYIRAPMVNVIKHNEGIKLTLSEDDDVKMSELVKNIPIIVTCGILNNNSVWSMCENEEKCVDGCISFSINRNSNIVGINGAGSLANYELWAKKAAEIAENIFKML